MQTLNLAFVADRCEPLYRGGYERHLWEIARRLGRQHEVTIFTSSRRESWKSEGVSFVKIAPALPYAGATGRHTLGQATLFALSSLAHLPKLRDFDFVDILGIPYTHIPFARLAQAAGRWEWAVTIWEAWRDYAYFPGWLSNPSRKAFHSMVRLATIGHHQVIVGSRSTMRLLAQKYGVAEYRIKVVSPGIDETLIESVAPAPIISHVAYVGRLASYKRVKDLLDAVAKLRHVGLRIKTRIIGGGPQKQALESHASSLGIRDTVDFLGWVDERTKYALLKTSKIFVLPSDREGFSIATLEAMACGSVPVVAVPGGSDESGVQDFVRDGETGVHFVAGDIDKLAVSIERLVSDEGFRLTLAESARQEAAGRTWEDTVQAYQHKVLESISAER